MAKLKDFERLLSTQLKEAATEIKSQRFMRQLGEQILNDVVTRVRLGYGVTRDGAGKTKLKPLSKSYIQQRKKNLGFFTRPDGTVVPISADASRVGTSQAKRNKAYLSRRLPNLASSTSASKSNLTRTGDMLASMKVNASTGKIRIFFKDSKNRKKADYVSEDRPFMFLTRQELKRAERLVASRLRIILRNRINF